MFMKEITKEKYKQLCLANQFGGINPIAFTQALCNTLTVIFDETTTKKFNRYE